MNFDLFPNTNFNDFIENCEVLKTQYTELLTPFFNKNAIQCWKKLIYSLDFTYWRKDKIWEYLNDDIEIHELLQLKEVENGKRTKKQN